MTTPVKTINKKASTYLCSVVAVDSKHTDIVCNCYRIMMFFGGDWNLEKKKIRKDASEIRTKHYLEPTTNSMWVVECKIPGVSVGWHEAHLRQASCSSVV